MFITIVITLLCVWGVRESVRANNVLVGLKVLLLAFVVIIGARHVDMANFHPFMPNGWKGVQAGAAIIFFAFIGFDAVSTTAEECKDPSRDMPRGILGSLVICTILYVAVATVIAGMRKYTDYAGVADPIAHAFKAIGMNGVAAAVSIGAVIAIAAALLVYQLAQPRIFMVMARDGLLPRWFGVVSPRFHTPVNATLFTGLVVVLPAGFMNIDEIVELTNIGTLFAFVLVCVGVLVLRVKQPNAQRKFKVPAVWFCGPVGIGFCVWLAAGLPPATWRRFWIWLAVGLVIYVFYGGRQARLRREANRSSQA
jgi:APA family basic amino acid/polyamine antiporter